MYAAHTYIPTIALKTTPWMQHEQLRWQWTPQLTLSPVNYNIIMGEIKIPLQ